MTLEIQNKDYFIFVLSKVREDLCQNKNNVDLDKACSLLSKLEESDNPERDIYLLTRVGGFETLGSYLLFILKKIETGTVNFENIIQNIQTDKDYIKKELVDNFKIDELATGLVEEEKQEKEKEIIEESKTSPVIGKTGRQLFVRDNQFKVGELDNELVTEQFNESDFSELIGSDIMTGKKDYLEEVQFDDDNEEDIVFNLPGNIEDIFEVLHEEGEKIDREKKKIIETDLEKENKEIFETVKEETETKKEENITPIKEIEEESKEVTEKDKVQEDIAREIIGEEISKKEEEEKEEKLKQNIEVTREDKIEKEKDAQTLQEDKETAGSKEERKASVVYMDFEVELILRNESLNEKLKEILTSKKNREEDSVEFENIASEIIENSIYMEEYSRKMSFDVIAGLYEAIKLSFKSAIAKEFEVDKESAQLFIDAILLIESLIKGYDYEDYDKVIKGLDKIRKSITEKKQERRKIKVLREKKVEIEEQISSKYKDESSRERLIKLKHNILEVEKTFNSLESIKGEYQVYEALRRLSSIFPHLKNIVSISKQLEQEKIAQLSEASYIFVKFLQNYRLDPFNKDAREILKYIIYNFKLIYLDKPTKDLDLLISYLNNPVKIFEQTKTKGEK